MSPWQTTAALVLPTSVSRVFGGSTGPMRSMSSRIAPTGVASSTTSLPRAASTGWVCPASIAPFPRARSSTGCRSQPMTRPLNPYFFKARPNDPPIRPVPTIVIWRMDMRGDCEFTNFQISRLKTARSIGNWTIGQLKRYAILRPTTGAIMRNSSINWANCSG